MRTYLQQNSLQKNPNYEIALLISDELSLGIWLHLPIELMQLVNFVMFVFIVIYIRAHDKKQRDFKLKSENQNEIAER